MSNDINIEQVSIVADNPSVNFYVHNNKLVDNLQSNFSITDFHNDHYKFFNYLFHLIMLSNVSVDFLLS